MEYLLLIHQDPATPDYEVPPADIGAWVTEANGRGIRVRGNRLRPPADATIVGHRVEEALATAGPFAETREIITGYDIFESDSFDDVVDLASRHPGARTGRIEIRPIWPMEG